jgi:hypothetical protein
MPKAGLADSSIHSERPPPQAARQESGFAPRVPQDVADEVVEKLRSNPRSLLGDQFVDDLRETVKESLGKPKPWRESSFVVALVPTLGAALIATLWSAYSRRTDLQIADLRRDYDQKAALKGSLDSAFERQLSAKETVCDRATAGTFQRLKREYIFEPEKEAVLRRKPQTRDEKLEQASILRELDVAIAQTKGLEIKESETIAAAYEKTVADRCVASFAAEFQTVFDAPNTLVDANAFLTAWEALSNETSPLVMKKSSQDLVAAAQPIFQQARGLPKHAPLINVEDTKLTALERAHDLECETKANELRKAYDSLSVASATELRKLRFLAKEE